MTTRKRRTAREKIPEAVERGGEPAARERVVNNTVDAMLDALNRSIDKNDLTFEEAFQVMDILHLCVLAKYIDFKVDNRITALATRKKNGRVGIA